MTLDEARLNRIRTAAARVRQRIRENNRRSVQSAREALTPQQRVQLRELFRIPQREVPDPAPGPSARPSPRDANPQR